MKQNLYTVHDTKANAFLTPFYLPNDGLAIRAMEDCVRDENHKFNVHAQDFSLFKLGEYDDQSGKHQMLEAPRNIIQLITIKSTINDHPIPAKPTQAA